MNHNVRVWLGGLISAIVGGAYIGLGSIGLDAVGGWETDLSRAWQLAGLSAISHVLAYLKQAPLPAEDDTAALKASAGAVKE